MFSPQSADAASRISARASTTAPMYSEVVTFKGFTTPSGVRTVRLQKKSSGRWVTIKSLRTSSSGRYTFKTAFNRATYVRVHAPATRSRRGLTSSTITIRPVSQRLTASALPGIVQQGTSPSSSDGAREVVAARITPARTGRYVVVEQLVDGAWKRLVATRSDSRGNATLRAALADVPTRVVALAWRGAPAKVIDVATNRWSQVHNSEFNEPVGGVNNLPSPWAVRQEGLRSTGNPCAPSHGDAVAMTGQTLKLSVIPNPLLGKTCKAGSYGSFYPGKSGHVGTDVKAPRFLFKYGIAAARIKHHKRQGQHGGFWLQRGGDAANLQAGAEIDTVEYFGDGRTDGGIQQVLHYLDSTGKNVTLGGANKNTSRALASATDSWSGAYHVFSVEWTPRHYIYRIDGIETFRITNRGISTVPEFLVLSLTPSAYEMPRGYGTTQSMNVDWVNVWQTN
ncbi:glycoside hydrolase family 16 protein [Nocardioides sp. SYSU DS0651]|uniref:glycoside hydrolase family 16 protein n=1 Tax=Nocardioides sp. SYSU DS0651 TaxID=3415955 RepID=UPI003F4AFB3B